ncbi:hypothetical protein N0V95_006214, partial [Ascochyta clinopodiicola]
GKGKKAADPSEQQKQIQAKIAQLELDAAGDKEQELEVGASSLSVVHGRRERGPTCRVPLAVSASRGAAVLWHTSWHTARHCFLRGPFADL